MNKTVVFLPFGLSLMFSFCLEFVDLSVNPRLKLKPFWSAVVCVSEVFSAQNTVAREQKAQPKKPKTLRKRLLHRLHRLGQLMSVQCSAVL